MTYASQARRLSIQIRSGSLLLFLVTVAPNSGCGGGSAFDLAQVSGTVTYADGSLIDAGQLIVKFVPETFQMHGDVASRGASTNANVADGSFSDLTTWKPGDGVMVGRHKVVVISLAGEGPQAGAPSKAVSSRYHRAETTPLEVEVTSGGQNHFSLKIDKGR